MGDPVLGRLAVDHIIARVYINIVHPATHYPHSPLGVVVIHAAGYYHGLGPTEAMKIL